jgi:hypothetical protein
MEAKLEKIITKEPSAYIWEDNTVIDITIESNKPFNTILKEFTCPYCSSYILIGNERLLKMITNTVHGTFITCRSCKIDYFIHSHVSDDTSKFKEHNMFDF